MHWVTPVAKNEARELLKKRFWDNTKHFDFVFAP